MDTIRDRVRERFPSLPTVQKKLIQQMLSDYEEYIFLTVNEAAQQLNVHKSTLVRLAQGLGYDGYADLRTQLQLLYRQEVTPEQKLGRTLADIDEDTLYQQVVDTEILYLKESLKTIRTSDIHKAAQMLLKAKRIFLYAKRPQNQLADEFEFRLRRFRMDVWAVSEEGRAILEMLQLLTANDLLVVISFNAFLKEHLDAIAIAKESGCPILLLTDTIAKDMLNDVDLTLAARRGPATIYHTNIVPMAIAAAIILDVARMKSHDVLPALERLHTMRRQYGYEGSLYHHGKLTSGPKVEDMD
jgi:DNA-binding MurR/RpiR family transcriptional regulator